jgi:hypothetical protein
MACLSERAVHGVSFLVAFQHSDISNPIRDMEVLVGEKRRVLM